MMRKHLLFPERLRQVPEQFSWLDQRLVRDRHIDVCSHQAAALYLFLVTVSDSQGLSYYSDVQLQRRLSMAAHMLEAARQELVRADLVCFEKPLYQVLALDVRPQPQPRNQVRGAGGPMSIGEILAHIQGGRP
jgi:hypothetical protein